MEIPWHISQIPCCYGYSVAIGNQSETLIIPLSYVILTPYLVWRFLGTIGISHIPCYYGNSVAMATRVKPDNSFVLSYDEFIFGMVDP